MEGRESGERQTDRQTGGQAGRQEKTYMEVGIIYGALETMGTSD